MTPGGTGDVKCAIWAPSGSDGAASLYERAARDGLQVAAVTASLPALVEGARLGHYALVLVRTVRDLPGDAISDILRTVRALDGHGCAIRSVQEPWMETLRNTGDATRRLALLTAAELVRRRDEEEE